MCKLATAHALSGSLIARQLPHRGSQGRLRRRICTVLPSALGGLRRQSLLPHSIEPGNTLMKYCPVGKKFPPSQWRWGKIGCTPEGTRSLTFCVVQPWFGGASMYKKFSILTEMGGNPVHRKGLDGRFALWGKSYGCHQFCQLVAAPCHWHGAFIWVRVPSSMCTKKFTRLE